MKKKKVLRKFFLECIEKDTYRIMKKHVLSTKKEELDYKKLNDFLVTVSITQSFFANYVKTLKKKDLKRLWDILKDQDARKVTCLDVLSKDFKKQELNEMMKPIHNYRRGHKLLMDSLPTINDMLKEEEKQEGIKMSEEKRYYAAIINDEGDETPEEAPYLSEEDIMENDMCSFDAEEELSKKEIVSILADTYGQDEESLNEMSKEELLDILNDITDTSDMHPNETPEEFFEHENFE